ncbi:phenylacetone monooxygenase [Phlyctema vagabunda]|uniref:Phenylacetone monooxygenase n=1 Tax=Phlyctema vagabunda TaxID=108571 RepID=A0ABR4PLE8_9HELO
MASDLDYDVIIIGAGLSGMYSLIKMRELGLRVRILEMGSGAGGTWFWNHYPGARFDSESYTYGFSFSDELLREWHWIERFSPQPENLKYLNYVCDKFDLRKDIQFNTEITSAHFQDSNSSWELIAKDGHKCSSRFLITAMGPLTKATLPDIPGVHGFKGTAYHTSRWPEPSPTLEHKRVAIIGTGATAIQIIPEIAKTVEALTVFQRTPNWTAPLQNGPISVEEMQEIRGRYPQIFERCRETSNGFIHSADARKTLEVDPEEREKFWEELFSQPGFAKWLSNFGDIATDQAANDAYSEFVAKKIKERVRDPWTADRLVPMDHGFGTKRVPLETHYYEAYNRENVRLVDVSETPIEKITETGIKTVDEAFDFDIIIYATGFDAITGAFDAVDFQGTNGAKLKEAWKGGPRTFLGFTVPRFPNMFMVMGPHQAFGNIPRSTEYAVNWISRLLSYCRENGVVYVEATGKEADWWTDHVKECSKGLLANKVDSWMTGVNKNLATKQERIIARYSGGAVEHRRRCDAVAAENYARMILKRSLD